MSTFEEAKRCPKCQEPGEDRKTMPLAIGQGTVHFIYCVNSRCAWLDTPWMVQVKPDGSIPDRALSKGPQQFQPRSPDFYAAGQRYVEDAVKKDLREEH